MNRGLLWLALLLTGCGRYADFTLPPLPPAAPVRFEWAATVAPVIPQGPAGAWDSHDALNPSVVPTGGTYYNFYSGFDGKTWHTGLATSADGVTWRKEGKVLSPDPGTWEGELHRRQRFGSARGRRISLLVSCRTAGDAAHRPGALDRRPRVAQTSGARHRDRPARKLGRARRRRSLRDPNQRHVLHVLSRPGPRPPAAHRRGPFAGWHPLGKAARQSDSGTGRARRIR